MDLGHPLRTDYARRQALVEIDVLMAMALGLALDQLQALYRAQFYVIRGYEDDTWYDHTGRILFTNSRGPTGDSLPRRKSRRYPDGTYWSDLQDMTSGTVEQTIVDNTLPGGPASAPSSTRRPSTGATARRTTRCCGNTSRSGSVRRAREGRGQIPDNGHAGSGPDSLEALLLTPEELSALAADLENYHVERKRSMSDKSKIEEAICAFANDLPASGQTGVLLVGVEDNGTASGLDITDQLLQNLSSIRSDGNILPFPQTTVYKAQLSGIDIAVVEVLPSKNTPLRLRGRVRVRVGPRRDTATRDEERILTERRRSFDGPYDQTPVVGATLDDLDLDLFRTEYLPAAVEAETLARNHRAVPEQLASLHLANPDAVPNVAGLVMLGLDPTTWVKGAYIQFLRIDGTDLTDSIVDRKGLVGPMTRVLTQVDELARSHIRVSARVAGTDREQNRPDYPMDALQQLLRNAVMHRNYETSHAPIQWYWFSDRIEIHNPGGLFGRASPETFGKPGGNDYRNPTIAGALAALGFVQKFGLGVPLARKACQDNGNPEPEFTFGSGNFAVILRPA